MMPCPNDDDLLSFVDGALAVEEMNRVRVHLAACPRCRESEQALRQLVGDVKSTLPAALDVPSHVRAVMDRLDCPVAPRRPDHLRTIAYAGSLVAAASLLIGLFTGVRPSETWEARGSGTQASLERNVGVQPYAVRGVPRELAAGDAIDRDTPVTAGFRNAGDEPAFLLLFAVDAHRTVHWISPAFLRENEDPASTSIAPTASLRLLATTAVLDDVPAGPLRIVSVVTSKPAHVSDVEALEGSELSEAQLRARLPGAQVRGTSVEVRP
jgi:anti-sigma factor RsiW